MLCINSLLNFLNILPSNVFSCLYLIIPPLTLARHCSLFHKIKHRLSGWNPFTILPCLRAQPLPPANICCGPLPPALNTWPLCLASLCILGLASQWLSPPGIFPQSDPRSTPRNSDLQAVRRILGLARPRFCWPQFLPYVCFRSLTPLLHSFALFQPNWPTYQAFCALRPSCCCCYC